MRISVDDERLPLASECNLWTIVRRPEAAMLLLSEQAQVITHISLDNDLQSPIEGRHIVAKIIGTPIDDPIDLPLLEELRIHSANGPAATAMIASAMAAKRCGVLRPQVRITRRSALEEIYPLDPALWDPEV